MSIHKPRNAPHTLYAGELVVRAMEEINKARLHPNMRYRRGYTTESALETRIGVSRYTLKEYFRGRIRMPIKTLDKLMAVLDFDVLDCLTTHDIVEAMRRNSSLYSEVNESYKRISKRQGGRAAPLVEPVNPEPPDPTET